MVVRLAMAPHWMTLPKMCASGRNSSTEPSTLSSSARTWRVPWTSETRLRWVSSTPLGRPVVPEV